MLLAGLKRSVWDDAPGSSKSDQKRGFPGLFRKEICRTTTRAGAAGGDAPGPLGKPIFLGQSSDEEMQKDFLSITNTTRNAAV